MPPTTISSAPPLDSFTPLADHQSQTPSSFYGAKPVLHYHAVGARALSPGDQISRLPFFMGQVDGEAASGDGEAAVVDAFISSEYVDCAACFDSFYEELSVLTIRVTET